MTTKSNRDSDDRCNYCSDPDSGIGGYYGCDSHEQYVKCKNYRQEKRRQEREQD